MSPLERRSRGGQASLTCQGRQTVSPNVTHFPASSRLSLRGLGPSWLVSYPLLDVPGEARMLSDVGGDGDHFSNFNVSCHSFHSGRIIIKYNLPWKSLLIASMCPKQTYELVDLLTLI